MGAFFLENLMPNLNSVIQEMKDLAAAGESDAADIVRSRIIAELHTYTNRNVICYYSGFLNCNGNVQHLNIDDMDKNGFMNAIQGMDFSLGLDLVLHTPGGSITAAESIVYYLQKKFSYIRVIIPQMAMSAGTMIACGSDEIVLGHQSCMGPFDPSIQGVSAFAVLDEFNRASDDLKINPHNLPLWQSLISKYPPAFLEQCRMSIELTSSIVPTWLSNKMFNQLTQIERDAKIQGILLTLNNPKHTKEHSRHIHFDDAVALGLNITQLESDNILQDKVLTLHHAYIATFMFTQTSKIIESHQGKKFILNY